LCGDYSKAARELGWKPKTSFEQLISMMVDADMGRLSGTPVAPSVEAKAESLTVR